METVEAAWFEPRPLSTPSRQAIWSSPSPPSGSSNRCCPSRTAEQALAAHRERQVEPILPKVIGTADDNRVVLPGDPDYPA